MGVFLSGAGALVNLTCLPHARGGVSFYVLFNQIIKESSPRPWGCFWSGTLEGIFPVVFPTPVGVFLRDIHACDYGFSLPHARGGVSHGDCGINGARGSSPRPWGCFRVADRHARDLVVFPTPVGVFPLRGAKIMAAKRLPHARGGVSQGDDPQPGPERSSPRPWGCFLADGWNRFEVTVFPTPVGVFPVIRAPFGRPNGLPHARGGVSGQNGQNGQTGQSSPRPWGCFLKAGEPCAKE